MVHEQIRQTRRLYIQSPPVPPWSVVFSRTMSHFRVIYTFTKFAYSKVIPLFPGTKNVSVCETSSQGIRDLLKDWEILV